MTSKVYFNSRLAKMDLPSLSIPFVLHDYDFFLKWANEVGLTKKKAETIIKGFQIMKTTREKLSIISHHLIKSFFLWYLWYIDEAEKELEASKIICNEWEQELKLTNDATYYLDYLDGMDYVINGMKLLLFPESYLEDSIIMAKNIEGKAWAGVLHVKQEFLRHFADEFDKRVEILKDIRKLNRKDSKACIYLAKTLGQKRKMENYLSPPSKAEMDLLVEGNQSAGSENTSILTELCLNLAQYLKNSKKVDFPVTFYKETLRFKNEKDIADFINEQTIKIWFTGHDAAPLFVKLAEIQSSLLPVKHQLKHKEISALTLVNRALEKFKDYSKGLHRKAKILFKLGKYDEGTKCLEEAFECQKTNSDALCDLVLRLMKYPINAEQLNKIFLTYCNETGEDLWGKKKVGTMFYLFGCYLWMQDFQGSKKQAMRNWLEAEKRNPNPTFYFEGLYKHKGMFKWHKAELLTFPKIIKYLRYAKLQAEEDKYLRDLLVAKLRSLL